MAVKKFTLSEPCPGCGGELTKAQQPTAAERAKAVHRDEPVPLPPHYDTAPQDVVDELGELWRCRFCGYPHREPKEPESTDASTTQRRRAS